MDIADYQGLEDVKKHINHDLGIVDILINNAGLMPKTSLRNGRPDDIQRTMDVNVLAQFWVSISMSTHSLAHIFTFN